MTNPSPQYPKKYCLFQGSQASIVCPSGKSRAGMNMGGAQWRSDTDKGNSKYWEKILYDLNSSQLLNDTHTRHTYIELQSAAHRK